ncbi:MAG: TSUP family transporter [Clostridia bacterium]|nr:TSUP family transporter [Clostridia bacterium]
MVLDMIAALIIALLSGMGIGSGGLLVLYLTAIRDAPQLHAQGINLLFFIFASAASLCIHLTKRKIPLLTVLLIALGGLLGSLLGARLALALPGELVSRLFGAFLVLAGVMTLVRSRRARRKKIHSADIIE